MPSASSNVYALPLMKVIVVSGGSASRIMGKPDSRENASSTAEYGASVKLNRISFSGSTAGGPGSSGVTATGAVSAARTLSCMIAYDGAARPAVKTIANANDVCCLRSIAGLPDSVRRGRAARLF